MGNGPREKPLNFGAAPDKGEDPGMFITFINTARWAVFPHFHQFLSE